MQNKILIDGYEIKQPDSDLAVNFETTYSEDSGRLISGDMVFTSLFTVLQLSYSCSKLNKQELSQILQLIVGRAFTVHFFNTYSGQWDNGKFYCGKGSLQIGTLEENSEMFSLSFNMESLHPITSADYWDESTTPAIIVYRNVDTLSF